MLSQAHMEMVPAQAQPFRLALIYIGDELYCLDKQIIRNVCGIELMRPNQQGGEPRGWLRIGAGEIPVFGLSRAIEATSKILILEAPDRPRGLIVDRIAALTEAGPEQLYQLPPCCGQAPLRLFSGIVSLNGRFLLQIGFGSTPANARDWRPNPPPPNEGARGHVLIFTTGQIRYGGLSVFFLVSLSRAVELMEVAALTRVPYAAPHFLGLANWRGHPLPIIDLSARVGFGPSTFTEDTCFLVVRSGRLGAFGMPICAGLEIKSLPIANEPFEEDLGLDGSLIKGAYRSEDSLLLVPDLESIGGAG
jgi:chemotaxis signal transduction protein